MKKFFNLNLVAKGPQNFRKLIFCNTMCANFKHKIPTQYLRLYLLACKNINFFDQGKSKIKFNCIQNLIDPEKFPYYCK